MSKSEALVSVYIIGQPGTIIRYGQNQRPVAAIEGEAGALQTAMSHAFGCSAFLFRQTADGFLQAAVVQQRLHGFFHGIQGGDVSQSAEENRAFV